MTLKKPYILAGLVAALGVSAMLVAPGIVIADEIHTVLAPEQAVAAVSTQGQEAEQAGAGENSVVMPVADSDEGEKDTVNDDLAEKDAGDADAENGSEGERETDPRVSGGVEKDTDGSEKGADADSADAKDADSEEKDTVAEDPNVEVSDSKKSAAEPSVVSDALLSGKATYKDEWVKASDGSYTWYGSDGKQVVSDWVVTDKGLDNKKAGLQRYWIKGTGLLAMSELLPFDDFWSYATAYGYVVRGKQTVVNADGNTLVYLADNDGRLESTGWHVTSAYGDGLQRYYVESDTHSARVGYSESGYAHYTTSAGYVLRGAGSASDGKRYADNEGRLQKSGWLVTPGFGQGLQRYWLSDYKVAPEGLYQTGASSWAYATSAGYVLRGALAKGSLVYLADNDGLLAGGAAGGWVVSSAYGQGLQRYWIEADEHAAKVGYSESGWAHYTTGDGYVLRGALKAPDGGMRYADNKGRLQKSGWLVTPGFGQGLQRYWLSDYKVAPEGLYQTGASSWAYATSAGYVLRGALAKGSLVYIADNDGLLAGGASGGWVVSSAYGQGLQRYWIDPVKHAAIAGYDNASAYAELGSYAHCTTSAGYVARGKYLAENGYVYLSDNDGLLETGNEDGWLVTAAYDGSLQRYRIDPGAHACVPGSFSISDYDFYTMPTVGWVLRGSTTIGDRTWYADNDGRIINAVLASAAVKKSGDATNIESTYVGDTMYLFLPSYASLSKVPVALLRWSGASDIYLSGSGDGIYKLYETFSDADIESLSESKLSNGAHLLYYKNSSGSIARKLAVMLSSDVTSVFVLSADRDNEGRDYVEASYDHSAKASVAVVVVASDGTVLYNKDDVTSGSTSTIKGRGNTTWHSGDKKPYQISLNKKADLLGTGDSDNAKKKWVLLANASDVTLLRNTIAYNLALEFGVGAMESTPADLWYDGEYRGSYLLCEKVEINSGRVDIYDLESDIEDVNSDVNLDTLPVKKSTNKYGNEFQYVVGVKDPENYSGGYLLEIDSAYYAKETCYFKSSHGYVVVKSPEFCSENAMRYISEAFQSALNQLDNDDAGDFTFDVDSLAKVYLINEYLKSCDFGYSSTYYYIDRDQTSFVASPVWDFDSSMGNRNDRPRFYSYSSYINNKSLWMLENAKVQASVKNVYDEFSSLVHNILLGDTDAVGPKGLLHSIDYYQSVIDKSEKMDEVIWGLSAFGNDLKPFSTYIRNYEYLVEWIENRINWLDAAIPSLNGAVNTWEPKYNDVNYLLVFDAQYYKEMNPDVVAAFGDSDEALLNHFVTYGMNEGRIASRNFNVRKYAELNKDLRSAFGSNWADYYSHYLTYGFYEGRYAK